MITITDDTTHAEIIDALEHIRLALASCDTVVRREALLADVDRLLDAYGTDAHQQ